MIACLGVREVIEGEGPVKVRSAKHRLLNNTPVAEKVKYIGEYNFPWKNNIEAIRDDCLCIKYRPDFDGTFAGTDKKFGCFIIHGQSRRVE